MTDETAKLREAQRIAAELRAKYHRERARLDALSAERDQLANRAGSRFVYRLAGRLWRSWKLAAPVAPVHPSKPPSPEMADDSTPRVSVPIKCPCRCVSVPTQGWGSSSLHLTHRNQRIGRVEYHQHSSTVEQMAPVIRFRWILLSGPKLSYRNIHATTSVASGPILTFRFA